MYYLDESEEEDPGPKYSSYVTQEDYEEEIQGFTTREWADSEDLREDVEPWDPQAENFFHIQY
jgi:hypothetical protein